MATSVSKKRKSYGWIAAVALVVLAAYFLFDRSEPKATGAVRPGSPANVAAAGSGGGAAPSFSLSDLGGRSVSLADFRGKVVVLDFWATWCPPCKREIPDFISLQKQYGPEGLQIVGIALDEPEKVHAFARQNEMNYPVLLGTDDVAMRYGGIEGIPTTFIIDRGGRIVNRLEGYRPRSVFEEEIRKLL
jgi:cytochrome c biogenesis protein CcmG/thiol:disulfide interchange protein DsbE